MGWTSGRPPAAQHAGDLLARVRAQRAVGRGAQRQPAAPVDREAEDEARGARHLRHRAVVGVDAVELARLPAGPHDPGVRVVGDALRVVEAVGEHDGPPVRGQVGLRPRAHVRPWPTVPLMVNPPSTTSSWPVT